LISVVLLAVGGKAAHIALREPGEQPIARAQDASLWPDFEIVDRTGTSLAVPIECFDLSLSPRAMWSSHTPRRIADRLSPLLGVDPDTLLGLLLPWDAKNGEIRVAAPALLRLDRERAENAQSWIETGLLPDARESQSEPLPLAGFRLVALEEGGPWTVAWRPELALAEEERRAHLGARAIEHPEYWVERLLAGWEHFAALENADPDLSKALAEASEDDRHAIVREAIWAELMPSQYRVVARWIDPRVAHELSELLDAESVSPWQMHLERSLTRAHPVRPSGDLGGADDAFPILGHWGVLSPLEALARARLEAGLGPRDEYFNARQQAFVEERANDLWTARHPLSGLELCAGTELMNDRWAFLADDVRTYERTLRMLPRDRRRAWDGRVPNYFLAATDASRTPRVVSTLDALLQRFVHAELTRVLHDLDPALAMAIAVDLQSGDVLAVDSLSKYPMGAFAPIHHQFTPGSTFKAVVMALALDLGLVEPGETFPTYAPTGIVVRDESGHGRLIREAEGAPEEGWISAAEGIAQSCNAVLVQIGLRIEPSVFRARLAGLGYGRAPESGLGPETSGYLAPLENGTWKYRFTHASVSFGHEIAVSLWQHTQALATILRGGISRPLRTIEAVEQDEKRWDLELAPGERVLSERAASELRAMLARGAATGTGMRVAGPEVCPEFYAPGAYLGTKTGTTEKVETELCLHVELAHNAKVHPDGEPCTGACRAALRYQRDHNSKRRTCYTSSMVALGRLPGDEREVLVVVVVEDARSKLKFGADVAGPSTIAILRAAFGLESHAGNAELAAPVEASAPAADWFNARDIPWAEWEGEAR
jgi:cell division protein FtsI/penicillin-binding protein 2